MTISHYKIDFYDIYRNDYMLFGLLHCAQITFVKKNNQIKSFISIVVYGNDEIAEIRNKNKDWCFELLKEDEILVDIKSENKETPIYDVEILIHDMTNFSLKDNIKYIAGF